MDIKRLVKEKNATLVEMGVMLKMYNEMVTFRKNQSFLTLALHGWIANFMNNHGKEIEEAFIHLAAINEKYFKTDAEGKVFLKTPDGQMIQKETADMAAYELEVKPLLEKQVEVRL